MVKQSFIGEVHLQVLGVQSDVLFPVTQQREIERLLKEARMCFSLLILEPFFLPLMVKVDAKFMVFIWVLLKLCTHLKINFNNVTYCVGRPP